MRIIDIVISLAVATATAACASPGGAPPAVGPTGRACSVATIDPAFATLGTVYRDCDVDRAAERISATSHPDLSHVQPLGCMSVDLEFVVGADGRPNPAGIRVLRATSRDFGDAIAAVVPEWRYQPAVKGGAAVAQVVRQHEIMMGEIQRVPVGSLPTPPSAASHPPADC